jgi:S1-C subfamily serine protease
MCVPAELLGPILEDLAKGRTADNQRPWLGVFSQDAGGKVVVLDVAAGGPAHRAELRRGDVVLAVAGQRVSSLPEFYDRLWALGSAGVTVPLRLQREREVFDVEVRSASRAALLRKRRFN